MRTRLLKMAAKLSAEQRNSLPDSAFALPGRRFPINDENHARAAISMAGRGTTPEEAAKVRAAVYRRYPALSKTATLLAHVTGASGSGKTTLLNDLAKKHPTLVVKDTDEFNVDAKDRLGLRGKPKAHLSAQDQESVRSLRRDLAHEFMREHADRDVVLGGVITSANNPAELPRMDLPNEGGRYLLDVGPLKATFRRYKRNFTVPESELQYWGVERPKLSKLWKTYKNAREDIRAAKSSGYEAKSAEDIHAAIAAELSKKKTAEVNLKHIMRDKDRDGRTRYESRIEGDSAAREKFLAKLKERDALLNHPSVRDRVLRYMNRKRGKSPGMFYFDEDAKAWTPHSVASRVPKGSTQKERRLNKVYTPTVLGARMLGNEHFPQTAPGEPRQGPSDWKTTRLTDAYISRLRSEIWGPKLDSSRPR